MMDKLRTPEKGIEPFEWVVQCVLEQAGKEGRFDFDELYDAMVGPAYVVAFGPGDSEPLNLLGRHEMVDTVMMNLAQSTAPVDPLESTGAGLFTGVLLDLLKSFSDEVEV